MTTSHNFPVLDLHCDLLYYLAYYPNASMYHVDDIGVALPHLRAGNVKIQTLAMFTLTEKGSVNVTEAQVNTYLELIRSDDFSAIQSKDEAEQILLDDKVGVMPAIENASGLCEEDEPIDLAFQRLEHIVNRIGKIFYIGLTHHLENRFGGGNYSDNIGLKPDGKTLLDYMDGKNICIDLAHTSDALAYGIIDHITKNALDIPLIASHSNFRPLCNHVRNLPDELTQEIISRNGLIGINFLRDYIDKQIPEKIYDHIQYGKDLGAVSNLAFGSDFFATVNFPDPSRYPLFFEEHGNASKYPEVLSGLMNRGNSQSFCQKLAWENALGFLSRIWG